MASISSSSSPTERSERKRYLELPLRLSPTEDLTNYLLSGFGRMLLLMTATAAMLAVLSIFGFIFYKSYHFLTSAGGDNMPAGAVAAGSVWENARARLHEMFTSAAWYPEAEHAEFGMAAMIYGSLIVTLGATLLAVPVGVTAALMLSDIVSFRVRQIVKPIVELLAAIPSVALGFFAVKVFAPWLQSTFGIDSGTNAINASIILAVMAIPTIVSVAEDAFTALGRELREASYALGSTRTETLLKVVIPAAHHGIIAAVVLGMMRAVGETMVVWMAAGNAGNMPTPWWDLSQVFAGLDEAVRTMTATIAGDMGETAEGSIHRSALFAVGLVLLAFTFILNMTSEHFAHKMKQVTGADGGGSGSSKPPKNPFSRLLALLLRVIGAPLALVGRLAGILFSLPGRGVDRLVERLPSKVLFHARLIWDKCFTGLAWLSIAALAACIGITLGPIFVNGVEAVVFRGTVEHRLFQNERFGRGYTEQLRKEIQTCNAAREPVYEALDRFAWLSPDLLSQKAAELDRQTRQRCDELLAPDSKATDQQREKAEDVEKAAKRVGRYFDNLIETTDPDDVEKNFEKIEAIAEDGTLDGTAAGGIIEMARRYRDSIEGIDLAWREKKLPQDPSLTYAASYRRVRTLITGVEGTGCILGPQDREDIAHLPPEVRFGATHFSMADFYNRQLQHETVWQPQFGPDGEVLPSRPKEIARAELYAGTPLAPLGETLHYVDTHLGEMLAPKLTFYWQYFIDPSTAGHFLGGVGPELLGTLLITVLAILMAMPIGVISAAYLIEVGREGRLTGILRMFVGTLAGVPSIVFGLFGLTVVVGMITGRPCVLAGAITLALLILPVVIRASEEAIRAVPQTYREASLGLGAGRARCFMTVTLPSAMPGILTGTILAMSRAAGETAPLLFTCAVATGTFLGGDALLQPTPILSYSAYDIAVGDRLAAMVPYNQFGLVATLIITVLLLNSVAIFLRGKLSRQLRGG